MEIVTRLGRAATLSFLAVFMSWMLLKLVHEATALVRALMQTPRARRPDSWRHHMDPVDTLGVLAIGLVAGILDIVGSPSTRDVLWPMVIYLWLVGLVLVCLNGALGWLYDRWLVPAARPASSVPPPSAVAAPPAGDEYDAHVIASSARFVDA